MFTIICTCCVNKVTPDTPAINVAFKFKNSFRRFLCGVDLLDELLPLSSSFDSVASSSSLFVSVSGDPADLRFLLAV